jgi:hypothetical protein
MMEVLAFPKRLVDIKINQTFGRYVRRPINTGRIFHLLPPIENETVDLPAAVAVPQTPSERMYHSEYYSTIFRTIASAFSAVKLIPNIRGALCS